jgi:hypothetical protein
MLSQAGTTLKRFHNDERGVIAMMFCLFSFVLFWCVGLAVDGARAYATSSRMARAVDAASLAGARGMRLGGLSDDADVKALTIQYFRSNYEATGGDFGKIEQPIFVDVKRDEGSVEIITKAKVPTIFGAIGGINDINVGKHSIAVFSATDLEISLQLDLTGSMSAESGTPGESKLDALKLATKDFIDVLLPDAPTAQKVRIGLAPFDAGVNAGPYLQKVNGNRSSAANCTYDRSSPTNQTTDDIPTGVDAMLISEDVARPFCPTAEVIAMTNDKKKLQDSVKDYEFGDYTAGHLGTAWAYYLLSPKWDNIWPVESKPEAYKKAGVKKIAVLMTDGDYNTVKSQFGASQSTDSIQFAKDTCSAMKADGIIVYTIGFKLSADAKLTMEACASGADKALIAENGAQLKGAFKSIATQIANLKLTQ